MHRFHRCAFTASVAVVSVIASSICADETAEARIHPWTSSRVKGSPEPPLPYTTTPIFTAVLNDREEMRQRFELLHHYLPSDQDKQHGSILGGLNSQSGEKTRDGSFTTAQLDQLAHAGERYRPVIDALRPKLQNIVLGDGRVENAGTKTRSNLPFHRSNFAPGSNDGFLNVPELKQVSPAQRQRAFNNNQK